MNNINHDEYLVLLITHMGYELEKKFLEQKNIEGNLWSCLGLDKSGNIIFSIPDLGTEKYASFSFMFINQEKWDELQNDDKYNTILKNLNNKKKIIYTHTGKNGIRDHEIKIANTVECIEFSHWIPQGEPLKKFLIAITEKNKNGKSTTITKEVYRNAIEKLIKESLKDTFKPHLIALSILCQGYLAAHEVIKLPGGISISKDKKDNTQKRSWWKPALGDIFSGEIKDIKDSGIGKELETVDKAKGKIECLMGIIQTGKDNEDIEYFKNGKLKNEGEKKIIDDFTNKVNDAYGQIKHILATK